MFEIEYAYQVDEHKHNLKLSKNFFSFFLSLFICKSPLLYLCESRNDFFLFTFIIFLSSFHFFIYVCINTLIFIFSLFLSLYTSFHLSLHLFSYFSHSHSDKSWQCSSSHKNPILKTFEQ